MANTPVLIPVTYPEPDFKITHIQGRQMIRDRIRKKNLVLTPEEWVRQNFVHYLVKTLKYPASLLSIEKEIRFPALTKRCDIVAYKATKPWMLIECKAPEVAIDEGVVKQILSYNMSLQVPYLILTNGPHTYGIKRSEKDWQFLEKMPEW